MQTIVETEEKPLGVIESLQQGFNFLNRHLWLLLLPVFLDLFFWLGPRLSVAALVDELLAALPVPPDLPPELIANFDITVESLKSVGAEYNLFSLLAGPLTGMPSLFARLDFQTMTSAANKVIELNSWQSAMLWSAILFPLGVLIGSFWLTQVVFAMRHERVLSRTFLGRWGWLWLNINLYLIALFAAILFFSLSFSMIGVLFLTALGSTGMAIFTVLWILFLGFAIWMSIGLYFVVFAIALDGVNLASAVWRSLNVVGRNALSTVGLLLLSLLLIRGFTRIWMQLSGHSWGVVLGIIGNAYLGAAIIAATFYFYKSRYHHWQKTRSLVILSQHSDQNDNA